MSPDTEPRATGGGTLPGEESLVGGSSGEGTMRVPVEEGLVEDVQRSLEVWSRADHKGNRRTPNEATPQRTATTLLYLTATQKISIRRH
jgi:hypothetical protein